jgi:hypothetical protein
MTNRIILKRSSVANSVPSAGALEYGELALNYTDGNLFFKTASNAVSLIASTQTANYSGNVTASYFLGNGALLTGVITSVANINNGTSNVSVVSSGGNVTIGIGGTGNIAVFSTTGANITGLLHVTGNVSGGNLVSDNGIVAPGNVRVGNILTDGYYYANGAPFSGGGGSGFTTFITETGNLLAASNANVTFNGAPGISVSANTASSTVSVGVLPGLNGTFDFGFVYETTDAGFDMGSIV